PVARGEPKTPRPSARPRPRRARMAVLAVMLIALLNVSAADPPAADAFLRQGNDAFARQDYENALKYYEQAEGVTFDPGLVAFNKAAAFFRRGQPRAAVACYLRWP